MWYICVVGVGCRAECQRCAGGTAEAWYAICHTLGADRSKTERTRFSRKEAHQFRGRRLSAASTFSSFFAVPQNESAPSGSDPSAAIRSELERCQRDLAGMRERASRMERHERLLAGTSAVLEMVARSMPLREVLAALCRLIEDHSEGALCGILLVDAVTNRLEHGAAPSLPDGYNCAIHGRPINLESGPCGMAACTREQVLSTDVATDTRWDAYRWRELAMEHGLRACWSTPILGADGAAHATFAIYWRIPRTPTADDQELIRQTTHLAAVAIEHQRTHAALQQSEQKLRNVADTIPGLVWSVEPDGEVDFLNRRWREYTGLSLTDARGWGWRAAVHPDDLAGLEDYWRQVLGSGQPGELEARLRRHDGTYRWFIFRAMPLRDAEGRIQKWYGQNIDIDDRRRAEDELRRSEAYLSRAQRLSATGSFSFRPGSGEISFSQETRRIYEFETQGVITAEMARDRVHPEDVDLFRRMLFGQDRDFSFECRLLMPDGRIKFLEVVASAERDRAGGLLEWIGAVRDVTGRKRAQDELRAAKARFEGILSIADDAVISVDSNQRIVLFNHGAEAIFGYASNEVIGQSLDTLLPARFIEAHRTHIREFARSHDVSRSMAQRREVFGRRKDGTEFPAEASISKLELDEDVVFTVILRDITERKRLEDRLRQSERNLAEGQRLTKTGSWVLDFKTGNTDWSVETCRIFGFGDPPPSPHYNAFRARVRPEDRAAVDRAMRESFETGEPRPLEYVFILPDGTRKHIETISQPVRDETGAVVRLMGTVMDVTERKRTAEALRASEHVARGQLEALAGSLAALSREPEPGKFLEHVLRIACGQLDATDASVWEMNQHAGCVDLAAVFQGGVLHLPIHDEGRAPLRVQYVTDHHPVWTEFFETGRHVVFGRIEADPTGSMVASNQDGPWYDWRTGIVDNPIVPRMMRELALSGVVSTINVPMHVADKVTGLFVMCFKRHRTFRQDELDLTRAMSHLTMLAIQSIRLSIQSRDAAVVAERNRFARDIHDTLAQGFTGVIVQLEAAADARSRGLDRDADVHLRRAGDLARESLQEARRSVRALRPRVLEERDIAQGLRELIEKLTAGTPVRARFVQLGEAYSLPAEWEDNLLRVGQEVLTNALRHARATEFAAELKFQPDGIGLAFVDNGVGFDPLAKQDGFGLVGIRERVEGMGGTLAIHSAAGQGTRVAIQLPSSRTQSSPA